MLTLHRDYFRLRKPIERRLYEIARKFCGYQDKWQIGLDKLLSRTGARTELKRFRHTIKEIARFDHLPDYSVSYDEESDQVTFRNRGSVAAHPLPSWSGNLDPDAYHDARQVAPGWDVRAIEDAWRVWLGENEIEPKHPARHFVKFCQSWHEKRGRP